MSKTEDLLAELFTAYTYEGNLARMEWIFAKAIFPLQKYSFKVPPVHIAVANGDVDTLEYLFRKGFDLNVVDPAIHGGTVVHRCATSNDLEMLACLLKKKVHLDLDAVDDHGRTPLHIACIKGHPDIAHALIESGVNIVILDMDGKSPRYYADISRLSSVSARLPPFQYNWEATAKRKAEETRRNLLYTEVNPYTISSSPTASRKSKLTCKQSKEH
ncbi:GA binding protein beta-1 chain [Giardia lamblia P15]|uniref:GA binding protein beta-1 chain n=1 Tax=Giardia intestinalis (strain P15) TaxID=658858 RepID=E1F272_GIAIA|nr:GA binding protein beta-1 chain [Giardia lamblia P15]